MRMTIEGAIHEIERELRSQRYDCGIAQLSTGLCDAMKTAVDVMRKYEKIERILNWREYDVDPNYHTNEDMINEIREVMKDGNVIYALTNFEDHNAAIKYLLPFWEKYRKIEQIVKGFDDQKYYYPTLMDKLHEVLEDGNDD